MPKLRQTEQERRDRALAEALARGAAGNGLRRDKDVAQALELSPASFSRHKASSFERVEFSEFCRMARRLGFTGEEVCRIVGVPYEKPTRSA